MGRIAMVVDPIIIDELNKLRLAAGMPSLETMGKALGISHSTAQAAFNGTTVSWITLSKLLKYFGVTDTQTISEMQRLWVSSKLTTPIVAGPIWAQELHKKLDLVIELLEKNEDRST